MLLVLPWSQVCSVGSRDVLLPQLWSLPQSTCGLEEKIAHLGGCGDSRVEFGTFWELIGEAAKNVKMETPGRGS